MSLLPDQYRARATRREQPSQLIHS